MKTLTFKYRSNQRKKMFADLKSAIHTDQKNIKDDIIYFDNLDLVNTFINPMKAKIIQTIQKQNPQSIYELADMLSKDQGYIQKEVKFLESIGILKIDQKIENGRAKNLPTVIYDKFIIDLDDSSSFKKAVGE